MSAKEECEKLMDEIFPLAEKMLREYGEFYPYGGYTKPTGEIVELGVESPKTDYPGSRELINVLRDTFREKARKGECKSAAIVFNVTVTLPRSDRKTSAIQVCVDHLEGYSAEVFFPYEISAEKIVYGETFAQEGMHTIFGIRQ
jgi:hypothetical protein